MNTITFTLSKEQKERFDAWHRHHWEVVHKNWTPPDRSGFVCEFIFGPTGCGDNVRVKCVWCNPGHQGHEVNLTESDDGGFIFEYDSDWNKLPAPWEKPINDQAKS